MQSSPSHISLKVSSLPVYNNSLEIKPSLKMTLANKKKKNQVAA